MGKYNTIRTQQERPPRTVHPIWRGIGFLFIFLIPVMSYALADQVLKWNQKEAWFAVPASMLAGPGDVFFQGDPLIHMRILMTIGLAFGLFAIFMLVSIFVLAAFGAPQYGPQDSPPLRYKK